MTTEASKQSSFVTMSHRDLTITKQTAFATFLQTDMQITKQTAFVPLYPPPPNARRRGSAMMIG